MVTLAIWGEVTPGVTLTICGVWGDIVDVITCAIFRDCRLRGVGVVRGVSLPSPIDFTRRPYNTGHTTVWPCDVLLLKQLQPYICQAAGDLLLLSQEHRAAVHVTQNSGLHTRHAAFQYSRPQFCRLRDMDIHSGMHLSETYNAVWQSYCKNRRVQWPHSVWVGQRAL